MKLNRRTFFKKAGLFAGALAVGKVAADIPQAKTITVEGIKPEEFFNPKELKLNISGENFDIPDVDEMNAYNDYFGQREFKYFVYDFDATPIPGAYVEATSNITNKVLDKAVSNDCGEVVLKVIANEPFRIKVVKGLYCYKYPEIELA